jgi:hypothetical protein
MGPNTGVITTDTVPRVTPTPVRPFKQVMQTGAQLVMEGADAAVRQLPGGPLVAAAVRPGSPGSPAQLGTAPSTRPEGPAATGADGSSAAGSIESVLSQNADTNLYYLELQERISAENRNYSALSNILKTRHETVKNAIGNIR